MRMERVEHEIKLVDEGQRQLSAIFTVERGGQERPDAGDRVYVKCKIMLPIDSSSDKLARELTFGSRVRVAGADLREWWGTLVPNSALRQITEYFYGETWNEAMGIATVWALSEIGNLSEALLKRKAALERAEQDTTGSVPKAYKVVTS